MLRKSMAGDVEKVTGFCGIPNPARRYPLGGIFIAEGGGILSGIFKNFRRCIIVHP